MMSRFKFSKYILFAQLFLTSLVFVFQIIWLNNIVTFLLLLLNISVIIHLSKSNDKNVKALVVFVVLMCASSFISWALSPKFQMGGAGLYSTSHIMTGTIKNLTTFFLVYELSMNNYINSKLIFRVGLLLLLITLFGYFAERANLDYSKFGRANNVAYSLICVFLLICSSCKLKKDYLLFCLVLFLVVLGAKRGAILSMAIVSLCYLYYRYFKRGRKGIILIPVIVFSIYCISSYIYSTDENLKLKIEATQSGDTSGREYINEMLWMHWLDSSTTDKIFGYEFAGSVGLLQMDSHNDWLELLTGQGVVGAILYALILIALFKMFILSRKELNDNEKFVLMGSLLMWVVKSTVSQTLYGENTFIFIIAMGFILGQAKQRIIIYE